MRTYLELATEELAKVCALGVEDKLVKLELAALASDREVREDARCQGLHVEDDVVGVGGLGV